MAGPYNPPNPYGSYFNFEQLQSASMDAFQSYRPSNLSPGTLGAMGRTPGGANPTQGEYMSGRMQNAEMARYMAEVYRGDPRTSAFTNLALQAMYGANDLRRKATVERMGGMGNLQEIMGFIMSQPGISGALGGGPASLGVGSYAMAASGLGVNNKMMSGDGPLQQMIAKAIQSQIQSSFYTGSGAATAATQGLNRDQLGGIMTMMASQGAFQGLNIGNLDKGQFKMDPSSLKRITDAVKSGAKAMAAIIDVYGDGSVAELMTKAQSITGLNFSSPGNAQLMAQRLGTLRTIGMQTGIDVNTMYDSAANGVTMAARLGLSGHVAADAATYTAGAAAIASRSVAYGRNLTTGGFIPNAGELQKGMLTDIAGMANDPIGVRRSLVNMLIEKGGLKGDAQRDVEAMMAEAGAGGISEGQIDARLSKYGINMPGLLAGFGGPEGVMKQLSAATAEKTRFQNLNEKGERSAWRIRQDMVVKALGSDSADSAMKLIRTLQADEIQSMIKAGSAGSSALSEAIRNNPTAARTPGIADAVMDLLKGHSATSLGANMGLIDQMIRGNPLTQGFASTSAQEQDAMSRWSNNPSISSLDRGQMKRGLVDGILDRYGGTDSRTAFARMAAFTPGLINGGLEGILLPDMQSRYSDYRSDGMMKVVSSMQRGFGSTDAGRALLQEMQLMNGTGGLLDPHNVDLEKLHGRLSDPLSRSQLFRNFQTMNMTDAQGRTRSSFVSNDDANRFRDYGADTGIARAVSTALRKEQLDSKADFIQMMGSALETGQLFSVRGGVIGKKAIKDKLTDSEQSDIGSRLRTGLSDMTAIESLFHNVGAKGIADLAKGDRMWGESVATMLNKTEADLASHGKEDPATKAMIKKTSDALASVGITSKEQAGVMQIKGSLKLGDKELELLNVFMKEGAK